MSPSVQPASAAERTAGEGTPPAAGDVGVEVGREVLAGGGDTASADVGGTRGGDTAARDVGATGVSLGARLLLRVMGSMAVGRLDVHLPGGRVLARSGPGEGPHGVIEVRDLAAVRRMLLGGPMGFAEAYLDGQWNTPDLVALLDLLARNTAARSVKGLRRDPMQPLQRLVHVARPNSRRGAKKNIAYHYDLGNDFYELWLDETMTYSCALFDEDGIGLRVSGADELAQAQRAKWDRLLGLLDPAPGCRVLEIGCGWGGFAVHAAQERGCRVTAITLSRAQLEKAQARVRDAGVDGLVDVRLQDYRDVTGTFDAVASIEMFEAVGERYWPAFFGKVRQVLDPGGRAALQVITIDHARFERYRRRADFIQKYIFPGGMLPSPEAFARAASAAGLTVGETAFYAPSYAATLSCWLERFEQVTDEVAALGFDERFRRMWRYYLAYCIAGFRNRMIDVMQVSLT